MNRLIKRIIISDCYNLYCRVTFTALLMFLIQISWLNTEAQENKLFTGSATIDITPKLPIALDGQMHLRIAKEIETPLEANILFLESVQENNHDESVIFVSCDLVLIPTELIEAVRDEVRKTSPEIDTDNIIINAIHTHTAPVVRKGVYPIPEKGVTQIEEYYSFFAKQIAKAIKQAKDNRTPGSITWGLNHAKVGYNRRAVYADNTARMYGKTDISEFRSIEGSEDQNIHSLFVWNNKKELIATCINVACPAQEVESKSAVNADYWHPLRKSIRERLNADVTVLGWIAAAGDQSPHIMFGEAGEERMRKLRGLDRLGEITRRIVNAVEDTYKVVEKEKHENVQVAHVKKVVPLPMRLVTNSEYEASKKEIENLKAQLAENPEALPRLYRKVNSFEADIVKRYEYQKENPAPKYDAEVHVTRIGDIVICTNPFELFTEYGIAMQARSKAIQTFVIQLAGPGTYLPTQKAINGGHYSAIVQSTLVGPEGGQILVDQTVNMINELFDQ